MNSFDENLELYLRKIAYLKTPSCQFLRKLRYKFKDIMVTCCLMALKRQWQFIVWHLFLTITSTKQVSVKESSFYSGIPYMQ